MPRRIFASLGAFVALFLGGAALAQSTQQSGPVVQYHPSVWMANGYLGDAGYASGSSAAGTIGPGISELLLTARGSGSPPYAATGTGPYGTNHCDYDGPISSAAGYHYLCFSANALGGGLITYGASSPSLNLPLQLDLNGTLYQLPFTNGNIVGPGSSTLGDLVLFNNTTGTLTKDGGKPVYNAFALGMKCDGSTNDASALASAASTAAGATLFIPAGSGSCVIGTTETIGNVNLWFENGAVLAPATGKTLTVNATITADDYQIFGGAGTVNGTGLATTRSTWFGALGGAIYHANDVSISSSSAVLHSAGSTFTASMVGDLIDVAGAGSAGGVLSTTVLSYQSASQITLNATASTTVSANGNYVVSPQDDSANLQKAINAAGATQYGQVEWGQHQFLIRTGLTFPGIEGWHGTLNPFAVAFGGSQIYAFVPSVAIDMSGPSGDNQAQIDGLGIVGPGPGTSTIAIRIGNSATASGMNITSNFISNFGTELDFIDCIGGLIWGNVLESATYGIYASETGGTNFGNMLIEHNQFYSPSTASIYIAGNSGGDNSVVRNNTISDNQFHQAAPINITAGVEHTIIANNNFYSCGYGTNSSTLASCIYAASSTGNVIANNNMYRPYGQGIILNTETDDTVTGNEIASANNGAATTSLTLDAILVESSTGGLVSGNTIWSYGAEQNIRYGINVDNTNSGVSVGSNTITGYVTAAYGNLVGAVQGSTYGAPIQVPFGLIAGDPALTTTTPWIKWCNSSPVGSLAAPQASMCLYKGGAQDTTLFIKSSGSSTSGWVQTPSYSYGTWTPIFAGSSGGTVACTTSTGSYEQIGREVTARWACSGASSLSGLTGSLEIGGLPLSAATENQACSITTIGAVTYDSGYSQVTGQISTGTVVMILENGSGNSTQNVPIGHASTSTAIDGVCTYHT